MRNMNLIVFLFCLYSPVSISALKSAKRSYKESAFESLFLYEMFHKLIRTQMCPCITLSVHTAVLQLSPSCLGPVCVASLVKPEVPRAATEGAGWLAGV